MFEIILVTIVGVVAAQALPGPSLVAVASAALGQGRRPALFVASGIATGIFIWSIVVAFGLGAILQAYPALLTVLKLLGGGYLIWLGLSSLWMVWLGNEVSIDASIPNRSGWVNFRYGAIIVLTNPTAALMWTAVASFLFGSDLLAWHVAALSPIFALAAFLLYSGYGVLFSTGVAVGAYRRFWRIAEIAFGGVFGVLGASLFLGGLREVREL